MARTRGSTARRAEDDDGCVSAPALDLPDPVRDRSGLEAGEVHLWWGQLGIESPVGLLDRSRSWLSDEERARGERFRREGDARAFLFRRGFLRGVLARYAGARPEELAFAAGAHGKPTLQDGAGLS